MDREENLIGRRVGNYQLTAEIASGSFGTVYRAHHAILTNRIVALKILHMHLPLRERERFFQEAQILEGLHHRHILPVIDVGSHNGLFYLASPFAPGGSLRQLLSKTSPNLLPLNQILTILTQIGEALHYAHLQNIVHCDLKPDNILFNAAGEAVLADFGIATVLSTMSVKQLNDPEGTPSYMAPEQFQGQVSRQSDQYALGCIAYELVTGQRPFSAPSFVALGYKHATESPVSPHKTNPQIAFHIEQAILKALAKQRNDRYSDVAAFLSALRTPLLQQRTQDEWFEEGTTLFELKRDEEALAALEQALHLDPGFANAYNLKGLVLHHLKRYEEALAALEQALHLSPNFAEAYNNKGLALFSLKRYEEALTTLEQALHLDPSLPDAYYNRGGILSLFKRYEEALADFEQALLLKPNFAQGYRIKGLVLDRLGRTEEAQQFYEKARKLGWPH